MDPCAGIQADISALLEAGAGLVEGSGVAPSAADEELLRRILFHIEGCERCHRFMGQLQRRVEAETVEAAFDGDLFSGADEVEEDANTFLARMLSESREKLAHVFYQIGRAYYVLANCPEFFLSLTKEPVAIPEYQLRGRAILDGVSGAVSNAGDDSERAWNKARRILEGESSESNLAKGRRYFEAALTLLRNFPSAALMLGHCLMQKGEYAQAKAVYRQLLCDLPRVDGPKDRVTQVPLLIYVIEHLGNLYLSEENPRGAARYFRLVLRSGAAERHSNFMSGYLNLSYATVLTGDLETSARCLEVLYAKFPEHRDQAAKVLGLRPTWVEKLQSVPEVWERLSVRCPEWFGPGVRLLEHAQEIDFHLRWRPRSRPDARPRGDDLITGEGA